LPNELADVSVRVEFDGDEEPDYVYWVNKNEFKNEVFSHPLFVGERVKVDLRLPLGYKVANWTVNGTLTEDPSTTMTIDSASAEGTDIQVLLTKDEEFKIPRLFINEVCASNGATLDEFGSAPDWIEIYNASDKDINLGGLFISDDLTNLRKFRIADSVPALTTVPARGYISLWADKETEQGVTHLGFELPKGRSQTIVLSKEVDGNLVTIDSVSYLPHENGESFARVSYYPESIWNVTSKPTFAKENRFPLTDVENFVSETTSVLAYVNPATEELFIVNTENGSPFWIVEGNGKVVSSGTWNGDGIDISKVSKGLFVLVINNGKQNIGIKLIKR
jgi:hypothetical protein